MQYRQFIFYRNIKQKEDFKLMWLACLSVCSECILYTRLTIQIVKLTTSRYALRWRGDEYNPSLFCSKHSLFSHGSVHFSHWKCPLRLHLIVLLLSHFWSNPVNRCSRKLVPLGTLFTVTPTWRSVYSQDALQSFVSEQRWPAHWER